MDVAFPVRNKSAAKKVVNALLTGKEKGLKKLVVGPPFTFAGPLSNGAYQQETITAKPGMVCAGVLHGNPGRARPHAPGHGADHQDRQVAPEFTACPVPRRGTGHARLAPRRTPSRGCRSMLALAGERHRTGRLPGLRSPAARVPSPAAPQVAGLWLSKAISRPVCGLPGRFCLDNPLCMVYVSFVMASRWGLAGRR